VGLSFSQPWLEMNEIIQSLFLNGLMQLFIHWGEVKNLILSMFIDGLKNDGTTNT
jgi:hypothetical protein